MIFADGIHLSGISTSISAPLFSQEAHRKFHCADDGRALKNRTGGIFAKSCWSERQDLSLASGLPLRKATYFGANHSSSGIDRPQLPSSVSHITISLCSSHQGCERRLLNAVAHIIDGGRKKLEAKGAKTLSAIWLFCCWNVKKKKKKESGTAFEGGEKQIKLAIKSHLLIEL